MRRFNRDIIERYEINLFNDKPFVEYLIDGRCPGKLDIFENREKEIKCTKPSKADCKKCWDKAMIKYAIKLRLELKEELAQTEDFLESNNIDIEKIDKKVKE